MDVRGCPRIRPTAETAETGPLPAGATPAAHPRDEPAAAPGAPAAVP